MPIFFNSYVEKRVSEKHGSDIVRAVSKAIEWVSEGKSHPLETHRRVKEMYTWTNVSQRTEKVYDLALCKPQPDFVERLHLYIRRQVISRAEQS